MSPLVRYIVDAIVVEGRSPTELARQHPIAPSRIYQLLGRFRAGTDHCGYDPRPSVLGFLASGRL